MITAHDIRQIISTLPVGVSIPLSDIQTAVQRGYHLSAEDLAPHTNTRPTNYPLWVHRVQGTLDAMKKSGQAIHDPLTHSYTFI